MPPDDAFNLQCPVPYRHHDTVQMAHGGGGRIMRDLVEGLFKPAFANPALRQNHDSAVVEAGGVRIAFTTVSPSSCGSSPKDVSPGCTRC